MDGKASGNEILSLSAHLVFPTRTRYAISTVSLSLYESCYGKSKRPMTITGELNGVGSTSR